MTDVRRQEVITRLMSLARAARDGKYDVHRGQIDWPTYDWPKSHALSIRASENRPWDEATGGRVSAVQITVATQVPESPDQRQRFSDTELDDMEDDVLVVMEALDRAKRESRANDSLVSSIEYDGSFEFSDARYRVQGYTVVFTVTF